MTDATAARAATAEAAELSIDELAVRTGTTVRNIRHYTEQGLVPPPTRRGRQALYGPVHRMRLELIKQLHDHGYTFSTISGVLKRLPLDATAEDVAMRASLLSPWTATDVEPVDRGTLERRAGRPLNDDALDLLVAMGVARRLPAGDFQVAGHLMSHAERVLELGIQPQIFEAGMDVLDRHVTAMVAELLTLGDELMEQGDWADFADRLAAAFPYMRPLIMDALVVRFTEAMNAALRTGGPLDRGAGDVDSLTG